MKRAIRISEAEWEVVSVVWERAPVAATEVAEALHKKTQWSLTTVRTLLQRLVNKGVLNQRQEGRRYLYIPQISREDCVRRESQSFLNRVLGRAPAVTLVHLVEQAELSHEEIQELKRILREKEKEP